MPGSLHGVSLVAGSARVRALLEAFVRDPAGTVPLMVDATISRVRMCDPSRPGAASSHPGVGDLTASTI